MAAQLLTIMLSSLITTCNEISSLLDPVLSRRNSSHPPAPVQTLITQTRAIQTSLSQLHEAVTNVPPTAIQEDIHATVSTVLHSTSTALHSAKCLASKFSASASGSSLGRSWKAWKLGGTSAAVEIQRVDGLLEGILARLGLACTLVKRWDRPRAREGVLILLRGQQPAQQETTGAVKGGFVVGSVVPVESETSSMCCKLP
jgi:hypothetical protein